MMEKNDALLLLVYSSLSLSPFTPSLSLSLSLFLFFFFLADVRRLMRERGRCELFKHFIHLDQYHLLTKFSLSYPILILHFSSFHLSVLSNFPYLAFLTISLSFTQFYLELLSIKSPLFGNYLELNQELSSVIYQITQPS